MNFDKILKNKKIMMAVAVFFTVVSVAALVFFVQSGMKKNNNKRKISEYSDEEDYKKAAEYKKENEIIKDLPIIYAKYSNGYESYREFRIDGGKFDECKRDFCLVIKDSTGGNREAALNEIKKRGYDVSKYEIIYKEELIEELK